MTVRPGFLDEDPGADSIGATPAPSPPHESAASLSGPILFEAEADAPTGRVRPDWDPELIARPHRNGGALRWFCSGLLLLLLGWITLSAAGFMSDQFHRAAGLGIITVVVFGSAALMLGVGLSIELSAWRALHAVDDLRAALTMKDVPLAQTKALCRRWLERVAARLPDRQATLQAIEAATTEVALQAVLRHHVLYALRQAARRAGRRAALEGGAVVAITPSDTLDGVMAGLRGLALVRQVARLYGVRPGVAVTLALLRRVAWTAAGVSGMELLSQTLADHALRELPIIKRLVGAVPGSGLAAMRLYRLAGMTAEACSPLPETPDRR